MRQTELPFQAHSETSFEAAVSMEDAAATLRGWVYRTLVKAGAQGMTDIELQQRLKLEGSTERPRRVELVKMGLVEDSRETRLTPSGRWAVVWRAKRMSHHEV